MPETPLSRKRTRGRLWQQPRLESVLDLGVLDWLSPKDWLSLCTASRSVGLQAQTHLFASPPFPNLFVFLQFLNTVSRARRLGSRVKHLNLVQESVVNGCCLGDLDQLLSLCPELESFRLEQGMHISNVLLQSLSQNTPKLQELALTACPVSDKFIPLLTQSCRQLQKLDLHFTNVSLDSLLPILQNCRNLLELDLSGIATPASPLAKKAFLLADPSTHNPKQPFSPLKFINLKNSAVSDLEVKLIAQFCPFLEEISLESCQAVTDDSLIKLIHSCSSLSSLDISFCENVTDLFLNILAIKAAASSSDVSLQELNLSACDQVTDRAIHQLVQRLYPQLKLLVLDGCQKITSSYIRQFSVTQGQDQCLLDIFGLQELALLPVSNPSQRPISPDSHFVRVPLESSVCNSALKTPLKTLTRQASRIIKQKSTQNLSMDQVVQQAEAFHQERAEKIQCRQRVKSETRTDGETLEMDSPKVLKQSKSLDVLSYLMADYSLEATSFDGKGPIVEENPYAIDFKRHNPLINHFENNYDSVLIASGRRRQLRKTKSKRAITPSSSPLFTVPEATEDSLAYSPQRTSSDWGDEPIMWNSPSLFTSQHSTLKDTPSPQESPKQSLTKSPCRQHPLESLFRMKIEVRKGNFKVLEIFRGKPIDCTVQEFCSHHGIEKLESKLLSLVRKKLESVL